MYPMLNTSFALGIIHLPVYSIKILIYVADRGSCRLWIMCAICS